MSTDVERTYWPGWKTVRLIGQGSFGRVYEIQRDLLGEVEKAALKVISIPQKASDIEELYNDGYDDESITATFKSHLKSIITEYSMMRKLNDCTNIVSCDDVRYVQHADGIGWDVYIKMELLKPLPKSLPKEVPEETVVKIARDLCSALVVCRKHEIVHRDIKPQNIFVSPSGEYKLGDFGIAKTMEKTMGGTKIGTYKYMAPEVYNNRPYGGAADVYSLGLVLYWLLNERRMPLLPLPPVKLTSGMDEDARNRRLAGERFPAPKHGSEGLKDIVMKACAYHVEDRYASAAEMLQDLNWLNQPDRQPDSNSFHSVWKRGDTNSEEETPTQMETILQSTKKQTSQSTKNDEREQATQMERRQPVPEESLDVRSSITVRTSQKPAGKQIPVDAAGKVVYIVLPTRVTDGQTIRYAGKGRRDPKTGKYGDLHLTVHVVEDGKKTGWLGIAIAAAVAVVALCVGLIIWRTGGKDNGNVISDQNPPAQSQISQQPQTEPQSGGDIQTEPQSGKNEQPHTHSWVEATCTSARYCASCGKTSGEALGHDWVEATTSAPKTCRSCGVTEGEPLNALADLSVGDTFFFGTYEQDNNSGNGAEEIAWIVLEKRDGKLLVISKYALDSQRYHNRLETVDWADASVRTWLNSTFYNAAFDSDEKDQILITKDPDTGARDNVFLLSLDELNKYFSGRDSRICRATEYAIGQNAYVNSSTGGSWWLLRTPVSDGTYVMSVNSDGVIDYDGGKVNSDKGTVRPVMWISTK